MRSLRVSVAVITALAVASIAMPAASAPSGKARPAYLRDRSDWQDFRPAYVPGEVLVQFRKGTARADARSFLAAHGARWGRSLAFGRIHLARLTGGESVPEAIERLAADPTVKRVEPNLLRYPTVVPNDPNFADLWGLNNTGQNHKFAAWGPTSPTSGAGTAGADINAPEAWDVQKGTADTVIAIIDSGVDTTHPDIAPNLWMNPGEVPGNNIDDDGNGLRDDVNGWDFGDNDNTLLESDSAAFGFDHGTHVAGTAAGVMNNSIGVAGVCPQCKIMALKIGSRQNTPEGPIVALDLAAIIDAFGYAAENGADVVNASFGAPIIWSKFERAAVKAAGDAGVLTVVAAGNSNGDNDMFLTVDFDGDDFPDMLSPNYPASYGLDSILTVAASNHNDEMGYTSGCAADQGGFGDWPCAFTNWGHDSVDVTAPGVDVTSTIPGGMFDTWDGTSMASPHVAGLAGLVKSQNPSYTPVQVKNAIMNSVEVKTSLRDLYALPGFPVTGQFTLTGGRVNAQAALNASPAPRAVTDGNIPGAIAISKSKTGTVTWPEDVNDVYKKSLVKGATYKVTLDGPGGQDFDLVIYKPGTKDVWQLEEACFGGAGSCKVVDYRATVDRADEASTFKATKSGTYYFHVTAWLLNAGSYTLKIVRV